MLLGVVAAAVLFLMWPAAVVEPIEASDLIWSQEADVGTVDLAVRGREMAPGPATAEGVAVAAALSLPAPAPPPPVVADVKRTSLDSSKLYVNPTAVAVLDIKSSFKRNPTAQLAEVQVPEVSIVHFSMFVHDPKLCKYISKSILEKHSWEGDHASRLIGAMTRMKAANPEEDGSFLDIGANVGYFAMSIASAGFRTVAIEPALYNTELIAASIAGQNLHQRLRLYKTAVAEVHSDPLCAMPNEAVGGDADHNQGNFQLQPIAECKKRGDHYQGSEIVPVETVDDIIAGDPEIAGRCFSAIKIDVEGFETKALEGARSVLTGKCPPCFILLEYIDQPSPFELLVDNLGYKCEGLGHKRANGQWRVRPQSAVSPYTGIKDMDFECRRVNDPRCATI